MGPLGLVVWINKSSWSRFVQIAFWLPLDHWILGLQEFPRALLLNNGILNAVGLIQFHNLIIRFTFSDRRITLFTPACLMDT